MIVKVILIPGIILLFFTNFYDSKTVSYGSNNENISNKRYDTINLYKIPEKLEFCNEIVPLHLDYIKERLERELFLTLDRRGQLLLYIKRSGRYFPDIESKLKKNALPDDLKYLSIAESALLNLTSNKGASGFWQLMEPTAKILGLKINEYVDERNDFEKSTDAAIKYLMKLYDEFNNWSLAVAAYNVGPNNIKDNLSFQWEDSYYNLFLNEETSRYIFRILALKIIFSNLNKYGFSRSEFEVYEPFKTRTLIIDNEIVNLTLWAKEQGTTYLKVKLLNPWILARKLPKGIYEIKVPSDSKPALIDKAKYSYKEKITAKIGKKKRKK